MGEGAHETAVGDASFAFKAGTLRFELSNYNYLGLATVLPSLERLRAVGMARVEAHVRGLAARLAAGLLELGLPVAGGTPGPHLAHIVSVGGSRGGRVGEAEDPAMKELHDYLIHNGVRLSIRRGTLRMALGIYNSEEDVDRVVDLCRAWGGDRGKT